MNRQVPDLDRRFYGFALDRAIAWAIDAAAAVLIVRLLGPDQVWAAVAAILGVVLVVGAAFAVVLGLTGWSPGNAIAAIRVVGEDTGAPVGVPAALLRQLVLGVATLPTLGIGVAALAWTVAMDPTGQRRGWHDHLVGSVVVDVRRMPTEAPEQDSGPRQIVNLTALRLVPTPEPPPVPRVPRPSTPPPAQPPVQVPAQTPTPAPQPTPAASAPRHAAVPAGAGASSPRQQLGYPLLPEPRTDDGGAHAARLVETPAQTQAETPAPAPAEPAATRWRVGFDTGESFVVDGPVLIGRRPEARDGEQVRHLVPLLSDDMSLSKTHAQVLVSGEGTLVVTDRGSTNGSILIRQGVPRGLASGKAATLVAGDRVRFGDREMTVERAE